MSSRDCFVSSIYCFRSSFCDSVRGSVRAVGVLHVVLRFVLSSF